MRFSSNDNEPEANLDLAPMIDMVFQLLIFFMVTTTFTQAAGNPGGIEVDLPKSSAQEVTPQDDDVTVVITNTGELLVKGETVTVAQLKEQLIDAAKRNKNTSVIIQADQEVHHGLVVEVMDLAKAAGLSRLGIATLAK